jgi:hypothetical protein
MMIYDLRRSEKPTQTILAAHINETINCLQFFSAPSPPSLSTSVLPPSSKQISEAGTARADASATATTTTTTTTRIISSATSSSALPSNISASGALSFSTPVPHPANISSITSHRQLHPSSSSSGSLPSHQPMNDYSNQHHQTSIMSNSSGNSTASGVAITIIPASDTISPIRTTLPLSSTIAASSMEGKRSEHVSSPHIHSSSTRMATSPLSEVTTKPLMTDGVPSSFAAATIRSPIHGNTNGMNNGMVALSTAETASLWTSSIGSTAASGASASGSVVSMDSKLSHTATADVAQPLSLSSPSRSSLPLISFATRTVTAKIANSNSGMTHDNNANGSSTMMDASPLRHTIDDALSGMRVHIRNDMNNLHVDMLRDMTTLEVNMKTLMDHQNATINLLLNEVRALRKEVTLLRHQY